MSQDLSSSSKSLAQEDQEFLSSICDENYRFATVSDFVRAAKLLDSWPDEKVLYLFGTIFLKQDFGFWNDEEESFELPFKIYSLLYQKASNQPDKFLSSFDLSIDDDTSSESQSSPLDDDFHEKILWNEKIVRNEITVWNDKVAFLLCFCKNFNFTRIFVKAHRKPWRPIMNFYIGKIVKRNPNISLKIENLPISSLYRNPKIMNSIYPKFRNSSADCENLFQELLNSILPCVFEWKGAKSLSFRTNFSHYQEFELILRIFGSIPSLNISFSSCHYSPDHSSSYEISCPNLESLDLNFSHYLDSAEKEILERIRLSEKFKCLSLSEIEPKFLIDLLRSSFSQIETLNFEICGFFKLHATDLLLALSSLKRLKNMEIYFKSYFRTEFVSTFINQILPNLPNLESLRIDTRFWHCDLSCSIIKPCLNLQHFYFRISDREEQAEFFNIFIENMKSLKSLEYDSPNPPSDDLFSKLPQLEALKVGSPYYNNFNLDCQSSIDQSFLSSPDQNLKSLEIPYLISFDHFTDLQSLCIYSYTPNLFREIPKLKSLEKLTIIKKNDIDGELFDFDSIYQLKRLKELQLHGYCEIHWQTKGIPRKGESLEIVSWQFVWGSKFRPFDLIVGEYSRLGIEILRL